MLELERSVAEWLLFHKTGLLKQLLSTYVSFQHLFPSTTYAHVYMDNVLTLIKHELLLSHLNINSEDIALLITPQWLTLLLGQSFLTPPGRTFMQTERIRYVTLSPNQLQSKRTYSHPTNGANYKIQINLKEIIWEIVETGSNIVAASGKRNVAAYAKIDAKRALVALGINYFTTGTRT